MAVHRSMVGNTTVTVAPQRQFPSHFPSQLRSSNQSLKVMHLSAKPPMLQFRLVPPPARLSDTKCPSSESSHHSPLPCFSFLLFLSPMFSRRIAPRRHGNGYAHYTPWFRQRIVWPLSDPINCVQTFNSLGQNPCTVAAYMMATCHGGGESSRLFARPSLVVLSLSEYTLVPLSPGYEYYGPHGDADADLCYCSTVAYSLLSACGACQGQKWIVYGHYVFLTFGGLSSYLSLAGRNG